MQKSRLSDGALRGREYTAEGFIYQPPDVPRLVLISERKVIWQRLRSAEYTILKKEPAFDKTTSEAL
jgi:hypothetical protein